MKILVTNDDGVESAGLHALARALVDAGRDVLVVAPDRDMSGSSAAIGHIHMDDHIDAKRVTLPGLPDVPAYAVDGPPGLCVLAARLGGFGEPPGLVVSGINPGCNTGRAVLHSGTVGAALTAANFGGRGLAVSIDVVSRLVHEQAPRPVTPAGEGGEAVAEVVELAHDFDAATDADADPDTRPGGARGARRRGGPLHWETAAKVAASALDWLLAAPACAVLNLNVPDAPLADLSGARAATLAPFGTVRTTVVESAEDGGRLQMELRPTEVDLPPECDTALVAAGFVSVSALTGIGVDHRIDIRDVLAAVAAEARGTA
jgi:5'-nucleotidase